MKSVADDIKDLLVADTSLGLVFAANLFVGMTPENISQSVTLIDTTGKGIALDLNDDEYRYEGVQVRVKGFNYPTQYQLANNILKSLHKQVNQTVNGSTYIIIYALDTPAVWQWEADGRVVIIFNIKTQRKV